MSLYDENAVLTAAIEVEMDLIMEDLREGFMTSALEHAQNLFILTGVDKYLVIAMVQDTRALQMAFTTGPKLPPR